MPRNKNHAKLRDQEKKLAKKGSQASKSKGAANQGLRQLLQKAIDTPVFGQSKEQDEFEHDLPREEVIDLEQEAHVRNRVADNVLKQSIHEANMKWHAQENEEFRSEAGKYALEFLKSMNGTLCYLMVAFRMLSKAPWTAKMVCVHIRQAAIYAISKGWYLKTNESHGIQFSRAELALAAGTFLGDLKPNLPDDPDQPIFLLIHLLPSACADLFSTGTAVCQSCGQTKTVPVPTLVTTTSWTSPAWVNLRQCIEYQCTPFPWIYDPTDLSWHDAVCERHDTDVVDIQIGPWVYVSFRGNEMKHFPDYSTVTDILRDTSLESKGLAIQAFVCCNIHEVKARHFWLLEIHNRKPIWIFDSLEGLMPITQEVTKKLWITGFLLGKKCTENQVLTSKALEEIAGKLERKERTSVPIAVTSRTAWLCKTQQQVAKAIIKKKKAPTKRSVGGQKPLGKFFTKTKVAVRTKPTAKSYPTSEAKLRVPASISDCGSPKGACQDADPGEASPGGNQEGYRDTEIDAEYGVISLFDGVSTVIPTLQKKLGQPPTVIVLAEIDVSLRALVCAEFGYRPDQTWGRTKHGSASLYVKDVNSLLKDNCRYLYEAISIAPKAKWIIVGGSPCQDLTFAGPHRGLLGLVGKSSRLFFTLLGVIRAMQDLATPGNVRFLVENAGSMVDLHYHAFCTLLGIPSEPKTAYLWDPADHGFGITRRRNFFRAHSDCQIIQERQQLCPKQGGPLIAKNGQPITLPPLLRTRDLLPFEVCWSSWTLYQPCALICDYDFWGGSEAFSKKVALAHGKVPQTRWEEIIPPPFQIPWKKFLQLLQGSGGNSSSFDEVIKQLIPMFSGSQIRLPIRILDELEVLQLSGLEEQWANTHLNDAERLPERVIRDYCGNCFHPKLIGSALGDDHILKQWINGEIAERTGEVANKNTVLQVYTRLCQDVEQLSCKQGIKLGTNLVKDFPLYPDPCDPQRRVAVPRIHDATIHGPRVPKQTKQERYQFSCNQAAIHYLGVPLCQLLRDSDLEICFDSFRAPTNAVFQFEDYIRFIFGCQVNQLSTCKAGVLCPPHWACLPICLPSGFVFHLGWGAVSASLDLSPNLSPNVFPIWLCLSPWLGCCVRLAGLVCGLVSQFVSHLALSFTLAGVLCPPRWACLPICLPSGFVFTLARVLCPPRWTYLLICLPMCFPSGFVFHLGWGAVSASLGLSAVLSPNLSPIWLCLSPWLGCCVRLAGLVCGLVSQFVSHLALSPSFVSPFVLIWLCLSPWPGCCVRLAGLVCGLVSQFVSHLASCPSFVSPFVPHLALSFTLAGGAVSASLGLSAVLSANLSPIWLCLSPWLGCCVRLPGLVSQFVSQFVSIWLCLSPCAVSASLGLSAAPVFCPILFSSWCGVSVLWACLQNFMCDLCNCLGSTVV